MASGAIRELKVSIGIDVSGLAELKQMDSAITSLKSKLDRLDSTNASKLGDGFTKSSKGVNDLKTSLDGINTDKASAEVKKLSDSLDSVGAKKGLFSGFKEQLSEAFGGANVGGFKDFLQGATSGVTDLGGLVSGVLGGSFTSLASVAGSAFTVILTGLKECLTASMDFNASMAKVSTVIEGSATSVKPQVEGLKETMYDLNEKTGLGLDALTEGAYQTLSTIPLDEQTPEVLELVSKTAMTGQTSPDQAVRGLTQIARAFGSSELQDLQKVSDMMFETQNLGVATVDELTASMGESSVMAKLAGVSMDELFGATASLSKVTGTPSEVATQLKSVFNSLIDPTTEMSNAMDKAGITNIKTKIESDGLVNTLLELKTAVGEDEQAFANLFGRLQGRIGALPLVTTQLEDVKNMTDAMGDSAGATEEAFEKQTDTLSHEVKLIQSEIENFKVKTGDAFEPYIKNLLKARRESVKSVDEFGDMFKEVTGKEFDPLSMEDQARASQENIKAKAEQKTLQKEDKGYQPSVIAPVEKGNILHGESPANVARDLENIDMSELKKSFSDIWTGFKKDSTEAGGKLAQDMGGMRETAVGTKESFSDIWTGFKKDSIEAGGKLSQDMGGMRETAVGTKESFSDIWTGFKKDSTEAGGKLAQDMGDMSTTADTKSVGIKESLGKIWDGLTGKGDEVKGKYQDDMNTMDTTADTKSLSIKESLGKIWDGLTGKGDEVKGKYQDDMNTMDTTADTKSLSIKESLGKIWDGLTGKGDEVKGKYQDDMSGLVSTTDSTTTTLKDKFLTSFDEVKTNTGNKFQEIKTNIGTALGEVGNIDGVKTRFETGFDNVKETTKTKFDEIKTNIGTKLSEIANDNGIKVDEIKGKFDTGFSGIKESVGGKFEEVKTNVGTKLGEMSTDTGTRIDEIKTKFDSGFTPIKDSVVGKFEEIKTNVGTKLGEMTTDTGVKVEDIKTKFNTGFTTMKESVVGKFDEIKTNVGTKLGEISTDSGVKVEDIKTKFETGFTAVKESVIPKFEEIKTNVGTKLGEISTDTGIKVDDIKTKFETGFTSMRETAVTKFDELKTNVGIKLGEMSTDSGIKVEDIKTKFETGFTAIKESVIPKFEEIKTNVGIKLGEMATDSGIKVEDIKTKFETGFTAIRESVIPKFEEIKTNVGLKLSEMATDAGLKVEDMRGKFDTGFSSIKETVGSKFEELKTNVGLKLGEMATDAGIKSDDIKMKLETGFTTAKDTAVAKITELVTGASEKLGEVGTSFQTTFDNVKSFLGGIDLTSIGSNIIQGLVNGIRSGASAVADAVGSIVDGAKSLISGKSGFETESPSKWTTRIGAYVDEGLAIGLSSNMGTVQNAVGGLVTGAKTGLSGLSNIDAPMVNPTIGSMSSLGQSVGTTNSNEAQANQMNLPAPPDLANGSLFPIGIPGFGDTNTSTTTSNTNSNNVNNANFNMSMPFGASGDYEHNIRIMIDRAIDEYFRRVQNSMATGGVV